VPWTHSLPFDISAAVLEDIRGEAGCDPRFVPGEPLRPPHAGLRRKLSENSPQAADLISSPTKSTNRASPPVRTPLILTSVNVRPIAQPL